MNRYFQKTEQSFLEFNIYLSDLISGSQRLVQELQ